MAEENKDETYEVMVFRDFSLLYYWQGRKKRCVY